MEHAAESVPAIGHDFQAMEMMALGMLILAAHMGGRLCRSLKLSEFTGQLLGGALAGPFVLHAIGLFGPDHHLYDEVMHAFHFFVFVFLSMVAFGIGEELHYDRLKRVGRTALIICSVQGALTWAIITAAFYFLARLSLLESLLIGSIGIASAPAVTFVLMNQLRVEGRLRHVLGSVVVIADLVEILLFSVLVQLSLLVKEGGGVRAGAAAGAVAWEMGLAVALGAAIFLALRILVRRRASSLAMEETDYHEAPDAAFLHRILSEHPSPSAEILLLVMGTVSLGAGAAYYFHLPFLVTAIVAGFLVANLHSHAIFDSLKIESIMPVLNLGFFALVGAGLAFGEFRRETLLFAVLYTVMRLTGKLLGAWLGCKLAGEDPKITACLPNLLLPQAGVGAVEAVYASAVLDEPRIAATILPAILFFEIFGVWTVERTLKRWRTWVADEQRALQQKAKAGEGMAEAAKKLLALLGESSVALDLTAAPKGRLIEALLDHACRHADQHIDRVQALQLLGEREQLSPTGFGHGIAIPHCRLMGLEKAVLVFARHKEGVVFGGVDDNPCDLILLILSGARDPGEHLRLLAATAHVLGDATVRERLRAAHEPSEFLGVLKTLAEA